MLEAILTDNGFGSVSVRDVDSALSVLDRENFDAILSDIRMPGRSGFELVRAVTTHERRAPVVLMSSFGGERAAIEAREAGAADFVSKPAWVGQHTIAGGRERIETLWHLAKNIPDEDEERSLWAGILAGADAFERG